jgi:UDP-N-acetylmuramoyl-L-alanyl-D-glutamate--2,6-diaminopimelate ligase
MMAAALALSMTLGELLGGAAAEHAPLEVVDLVLDSRQVSEGAAFVAVPGGRTHGLAFAPEALVRGAAIVLYEPDDAYPDVPQPSLGLPGLGQDLGRLARAFFGRKQAPSEIAAVTGTNGKTTVAYLIAQAMARTSAACAYIGTLGYGTPGALRTHELTTPDCLSLHREIAAMGVAHVALEASSHALQQDRLAGLEIAVAAFSNLTRDHLDQHGSLASYGAAKARLFARPELGAAVINVDDAFGARLAEGLAANITRLRTSLRRDGNAELYGRYESLGLDGLELSIDGHYGAAKLRSRLIGDFNAENLLLALGSMLAWGVPLGDAGDALAAAAAAPGRMDVLERRAGRPTVIVDYAHTPAGLERALAVIQALSAGDVWCVFGCGGDRDRGKRAAMGQAASQGAAHLVITDDNPRQEDPARIVREIRAGVGAHRDVVVEHARELAIEYAVSRAAPDDVVLIAGKGHETMQLAAGQRREFDDRRVASDALGART